MSLQVHHIQHPLIQHKLSILRDKTTPSPQFRALLNDISKLLAYEVTKEMPIITRAIETPLAPMDAPFVAAGEVCLVSVLRAGNGLLNGMLELLPEAKVGHVGLYREPSTHIAIEYYFKMPPKLSQYDTIVVDPMLATGHSAVAALDRVKSKKPRSLKYVCLLAAPEGIAHLQEHHPEVPIYTAAIDSHLDDHKYIVPGLGDAGDRMYGTQ